MFAMASLVKLFLLLFIMSVVTCQKVPMDEIRSAFKEMDTDGDGKVTLKEITVRLERKKEVPTADHEGMAQSIYEFYDKDKDGYVTLKEFLPQHDEL